MNRNRYKFLKSTVAVLGAAMLIVLQGTAAAEFSLQKMPPAVSDKTGLIAEGKGLAGDGGIITENSISKDENIYISLDSDGSFKEAYVVNAFELDKPGLITDYGRYDSVKNLSTADELEYDGEKITIEAPKGRFYYQGNLSSIELPWRLSVSYYLEGNQVTAQQLPGADGALEIRISIRKNPGGKTVFFENYALQTTVNLDAKNCTGILAEGATVVNAGSKKTISYTLLPGEEADYAISANVTGFRMDGIQLSGIPLSIRIDRPDTGEFTNQISLLQEGTEKLDNGAQDLKEGAFELRTGAMELTKGIKNMLFGLNELNGGIKALASQGPELVAASSALLSGMEELLNGVENFTAVAANMDSLTTGSEAIKGGISGLQDGVGRLKDGIKGFKDSLSQNGMDRNDIVKSNNNLVQSLSRQINLLEERLNGVDAGGATYADIQSQIALFKNISDLLKGNSAVISADEEFIKQLEKGLAEVYKGAEELSRNYESFDAGIQSIPAALDNMPQNLEQLKNALSELAAGYKKLDSGLSEYIKGVGEAGNGMETAVKGYSELVEGNNSIYTGIVEISKGIGKLAEGTEELRKRTSTMESDIEDAIDKLMESYTGGDFEVESYISPNNKNVETVQFIMQTPAIERDDSLPEPKSENKKQNFWTRLIALFCF